MRPPSAALLALYEQCLVGSLVACEVTVRELENLEADDFSDVRMRRLFCILAELAELAELEYPSGFDLVTAAIAADPEHARALTSLLCEAYADFVSKETALSYAQLISTEGKSRREQQTFATQIARRSTR